MKVSTFEYWSTCELRRKRGAGDENLCHDVMIRECTLNRGCGYLNVAEDGAKETDNDPGKPLNLRKAADRGLL